MNLSDDAAAALAAEFDAAERQRSQIRAASLRHPGLTLADGYRIQSAWVDLRLARGERVVGHKIGLTSRAMQMAVGIDMPDYGVLTDAMVIDDGATIAPDRFISQRFEVELGFWLKAPLAGPNLTVVDVLNATDWIVPAIEVIDSRAHLRDPDTGAVLSVADSIADNALNAGVIWGGRPVRPGEIDLRYVPGILIKNGKVEETGVSAGVMGHPATGIVWLARELNKVGASLAAGEFVLSGSFTRPVAAGPGDTIACDFGPLGQVCCSVGRAD